MELFKNILYNNFGDFVNKLKLDYDKCIGCGFCFYLNKKVFSINEEGFCKIKKEKISTEDEDTVKRIIEICPTKALKIVKANQS